MTKNKLIFLGCGSSQGVPQINPFHPQGDWGQCDPHQSKNYRTRSSVYIEYDGCKILIDTTPDLRTQYLREQLTGIDAVLYTHLHGDHTYGIAELKNLHDYTQKKMDLYSSAANIDNLKANFPYFFNHLQLFNLHPVESKFTINTHPITVFKQVHGHEISLGFRFGNLAYSTDFAGFKDDHVNHLKDLDVWILGCTWLDFKTPSHLDLKGALAWYERIKPKKMYLTHMNKTLDYHSLCAQLPEYIRPAYDGLSLNFK